MSRADHGGARGFVSAAAVALLMIALSVLAGCGSNLDDVPSGAAGDGSTSTTIAGEPVTFDQAADLSRALNQNYEAGGARITIDAPVADGVTVHGDGQIDWNEHFGHLSMERRIEGSAPTNADRRELFWAPEATLEGGLPGFGDAMAAQGRPGVAWVQRPADSDQNLTDRLLAFVMRLASERVDNPTVVQQDGALYLGTDTIDGVETSIYRLGRGTYWLAEPDGMLVRYQAEVTGLPGPVVVTLRDHGPVQLETPPMSAVVQQSDVDATFRVAAGAWPFPA